MKYLLLFLLFLGFTSCKDSPKTTIKDIDKTSKTQKLTDQSLLGKKYASASKAALGKKLMSAIAKNGPEGAVKFCNANALQITDSLSLAYGAKIRRVTDKPRNPLNQANKKELMHIADFKEKLVSGDEMSPIMDLVDGQVNFYSPIITNAMCLQCHGKPEAQIAAPTLSKLDKLYPKDMAREYQENEVRGIWAISFKQTN